MNYYFHILDVVPVHSIHINHKSKICPNKDPKKCDPITAQASMLPINPVANVQSALKRELQQTTTTTATQRQFPNKTTIIIKGCGGGCRDTERERVH